MKYENFILEKVKEYVEKEQMFTSIDIANAIKNEGIWVRNIEIRDWLHNHFHDKNLFMGYLISPITVLDNDKASLYHPALADPESYQERDQLPLTPDQVKAIQKVKVGKYKSDLDIKKILHSTNSTKAINKKDKTIRKNSLHSDSVILCSKIRLRIPAEYIRKIGWKPGDSVDPSLILTTKVLSNKLTVNHDNRVSIPRNAIPWGDKPVKVSYKDGKIHFNKA
jgi:hypothetical protein